MNLVHYRFADDFCTHLSYSVKTIAIREHIQNVLDESIQLNAIDLLNDALKATWMQMTQKEKAEYPSFLSIMQLSRNSKKNACYLQ